MQKLLLKLSIPALAVLICIGVLFGITGLEKVEPGETVIMVKMFGEDKGMQDDNLPQGVSWVNPMTFDTFTYNWQRKQYDTGLTDMEAETSDGQPVLVDLSAEIGLTPTMVQILHTEVGRNWYNDVVYPAIRSENRIATSSQASDVIYTSEGRIAMKKNFEAAMDKRFTHLGINVTINIRDIEFVNKEFVGTLERKAMAAQNVQIKARDAEAAVNTAIEMENLAEGSKQQRIKAAEAAQEEKRLEGLGQRQADEERAIGILAVATVEAEGVRLRREALAGAGGAEMVSMEWARNLGPNVKVYGIPTGAPGTASMMDLNGMLGGAFKGMNPIK